MFTLLVLVLLGVLVFGIWGVFSWQVSFNLFGYTGVDYSWLLQCDNISLFCLFMLGCCGSLALLYCHHYFGGGVEGGLLFPLIVWFLVVMGVLIFTSSLVLSLVLWEYLGLVSFLLILFYSNSYSLRASLITLFASRFGDVSLFLMIMWLSWWLDVSYLVFSFWALLVIMSKSACYPFISWLLEAMRAPTPVSSLVHSSTLVAAGIWFFLRYEGVCSINVSSVLFSVCMLTILITGVSASVFDDLKKVVALSTCNNVSWCVVFFICGDLGLALLQLLTHGVCKCYLFMSVGDLMSQSGGSQASVGVYLGRYSGKLGVCVQSLLILSLCGLPFLGVFFSKHGLFSSFLYSFGAGSLGLMFLGFLLTCVYSVRFVLMLLSCSGGLSSGYSSLFYLIVGVSFLGTLLNFIGGVVMSELYEMGYWFSVLLVMLQAFGCLLGWLAFIYSGRLFSFWESVLWGGDSLVRFLYSRFMSLSNVSVIGIYRWEPYLLHLWPTGGWFSTSVFSMNFLICGLLFTLFFLFLLGV